MRATRAANEIGLTAPEKLPARVRPDELDGYRLGQNVALKMQGPRYKQGPCE